MVDAWCKAAKSNASPAAMHKLLQVRTPALLAFRGASPVFVMLIDLFLGKNSSSLPALAFANALLT